KPINPKVIEIVSGLTGTTDLVGMLHGMEDFTESMKADYRQRVKQHSEADLGSFAEHMNYDQPPAKHQQFICDYLMMAERGELEFFTLSAPPGHAKPIDEDSYVIAKPSLDATGVGKGNDYNQNTMLKDVQPGWYVWTHRKRWRKVLE